MNILLINHYAGSPRHGMEYRPYYLAREWVRLGHKVRIVASAQSHVRAQSPQLAGQARLDEIIDGIQYTWFETPRYAGNGIARVRNMAAFVARLYREGRELARAFKPDLVIASSTYPMDIWPAHRIAKLAAAKLVFEVHDMWPLSPIELGGMSRRHPFIMLVQAAEDYAYRHADVVISMLPKVHEYMQSRGMAPHKLHIVPNGIDPAEWLADAPALQGTAVDILANLRAQGWSIVGHAGTQGLSNALDIFLDTAKLMQGEKVAFVLVGGGPAKSALQQRAKTEGLQNVRFIDAVEKAQIPALLQWFDVAYIGVRRMPLYRFGIAPNKLMDYMMAGRPVVMAIEAGNDPVTEAGCGLTVKPEDPHSVAKGIRALLALSADERKAMAQRGREFVMKNHTYPVLGQRFLTAIQSLKEGTADNHAQVKMDEPQALIARYARRKAGTQYSLLRPEVWLGVQERQHAMLRMFAQDIGWRDLANVKLSDVGCGGGGNLLDFLRFGFAPKNLCGIELLPERAAMARQILPAALVVHEGDANAVSILPASQHVVFQSVVFSSLLDDRFQQELAARMWHWVKPGGGILWYDFIYNNPANPDVRGVPVKRVRQLFPEGEMTVRRITLAPPISRRVCRIHPNIYHVFNAIPLLRTHVLCWIHKR